MKFIFNFVTAMLGGRFQCLSYGRLSTAGRCHHGVDGTRAQMLHKMAARCVVTVPLVLFGHCSYFPAGRTACKSAAFVIFMTPKTDDVSTETIKVLGHSQ